MWRIWNNHNIAVGIVKWCSHCGRQFSSSSKYRHTLFHHPIFYFASQILCFLQNEGLWQPCVEQVYQRHFSNSTCHFVSLCHILVILAIFQTFSLLLYFLWWSVISDLWCYYVIIWGCHEPHPDKMANLIDKCCVRFDYFTNQPFPHLSPSPQASLFPETQQY